MSTDAIAPEIRSHILSRLAAIEAEHDVRILLAVESGSRAWGFPSPDSDYDVRFIYQHALPWYVSLSDQRDVIEKGIDEKEIDLSGWDIRKSLRLLLKSNPVLFEWLASPIQYRANPAFVAEARELFEKVASRRPLAYHYWSQARSQWRQIDGRETVKLKKYFYAVRPLLALDWVLTHRRPPPMQLEALLAGGSVPDEVMTSIRRLRETKRLTAELGIGPRLGVLDRWLQSRLSGDPPDIAAGQHPQAHAAADAFYRRLIGLQAGT